MEANGSSEITATSETLTPNENHTFSIEFRGKTGEYFRIWIVNTALTLLTFGIYSAWAKVRTRRYFDNHTFLNGFNFDYHGNPIKILKGRIIIGALFLVYLLVGKISPILGRAAPIMLSFVYPWIMVKSLTFNLGNTSYRGIRFRFEGSYRRRLSSLYKVT